MTDRKIDRVVVGTPTIDGAGVKLTRVIGRADVKMFDPFLLLDAFDSKDPDDYIAGFPLHPHRGIETVTYLIAGEIDHQDTLGNKGAIHDGCSQWMTAGSGIQHQEMPQASPRLYGVQLWINLPQKDKMTTPEYRGLEVEDIPRVQEEGVSVGIIAGDYHGKQGATQGDYVKTLYLDVDMQANSQWQTETPAEMNLFVYILEGDGYFDEAKSRKVEARQAVLFTPGDRLTAFAGEQGMRFLVIAGKPLREPIAWGGPIVMNTKEELDKAFEELATGKFIKEKSIGI